MQYKNRKVVFFCESVTLAHVARCRLLADALARGVDCEIVFYCDAHYDHLFSQPVYQVKPLCSTPPEKFIEWNLKSQPIWPTQRIKDYLAEDERILDTEKPSLVIGDMRHTLQISAKAKNIPYLNIINGYWCAAEKVKLPIPDVMPRRLLGTALSQAIFDVLKPVLMIPHTKPFAKARKRYGLAPIVSASLPHIFCESDYNVYLDLPSLVNMDLSDRKRAIGPVLWSPEMSPPAWWLDVPKDKPIVYLNLGSSGDANLLPALVAQLAQQAITVIVGTASDDIVIPEHYPNVYSAKFIPGNKACEIADISITNGGSPTTMQALAYGIFSIGICFNIDQLVNMQALKAAGVGDYFYPANAEFPKIIAKMMQILENKPDLTKYVEHIESADTYAKFNDFVTDILDAHSSINR